MFSAQLTSLLQFVRAEHVDYLVVVHLESLEGKCRCTLLVKQPRCRATKAVFHIKHLKSY